jgi:hypothetical protein
LDEVVDLHSSNVLSCSKLSLESRLEVQKTSLDPELGFEKKPEQRIMEDSRRMIVACYIASYGLHLLPRCPVWDLEYLFVWFIPVDSRHFKKHKLLLSFQLFNYN